MKSKMIMTKAPLRITFTGGGTDTEAYYASRGPGAVINSAIDKYIYVAVNKKFDNEIRVSYSKTEIVPTVDDIKHPTVREALRLLGVDGGIEIVSISDIPSGGTGLGSSSTFVVALLHALHAWKGEAVSAKQLAEEAVHIEREVLKEPGGKQDQYIAAYGGFQFMEFNKDASVSTQPVITNAEDREMLRKHLQLFYTGKQRDSTEIHTGMAKTASNKFEAYDTMRDLTYQLYHEISNGNWQATGQMLDMNWKLKQQLENRISDSTIGKWYAAAMAAGADGGKVIGAGGGGFMLFFAPPEKHEAIRRALPELREETFDLEALGSRIIYVGE